MADTLPDELISEILSPALRVPDDAFSDTSLISPFASLAGSSSATLLVCKAWLRVATPLLYSVVIIRSKAQAHALQTSLKDNPELGRFIRKLRVEGGFGSPMRDILRNAPNISDIFLSLQLHASDSSSGLALGLPLINPTRLIIFDRGRLANKAVIQLRSALEGCVEKWTNLRTISFPSIKYLDSHVPFCTTIVSRSTARTVSFQCHYTSVDPWLELTSLIELAQSPSLEAIEVRSKHATPLAAPLPSTDARLNRLLRWEEASTKKPVPTHKGPHIARPIDPLFCPMASAPKATVERIWRRILFFAMLSLEQHPENTGASDLADTGVNSGRLQFLLVSRTYYRLARPYLYYYPVFYRPGIFPTFADTVNSQPSLAQHIREVDLSECGSWWHHSAQITGTIASILPLTHNLTRLIGNHFQPIPWSAFAALAETAGRTLQEFVKVRIFAKDETVPTSGSIFNKFPASRSFSWECRRYTSGIFSDDVDPAAFPFLESLTLHSADVLPVFSAMRLPSLRRAVIRLIGDWDITFLRTHGAKLQELEIENGTISGESALALCPNATTLTFVLENTNGYGHDPGCAFLNDGSKHVNLSKIVVRDSKTKLKAAEEKKWDTIFEGMIANVSSFPALRELSITSLVWPTAEHEIAKYRLWIEWAAIFLAHGIKLTDRAGTEWRPRLELSRGKGRG